MQLLYTHRNSSKAMITQLVLALADLSTLLVEWMDPVALMFQTYSNEPDMISIILEFLTVLPEEVNDNRLLTNEVIHLKYVKFKEIRETCQRLLVSNSKKVLDFLLQVDDLVGMRL